MAEWRWFLPCPYVKRGGLVCELGVFFRGDVRDGPLLRLHTADWHVEPSAVRRSLQAVRHLLSDCATAIPSAFAPGPLATSTLTTRTARTLPPTAGKPTATSPSMAR